MRIAIISKMWNYSKSDAGGGPETKIQVGVA